MKSYFFIATYLLIFYSQETSSQCITGDSLRKKINFVSNPGNKTDPLKELLSYEKAIQNCPQKNDSVHAFLLLKIAVNYYKLTDYLYAVQYLKQAIELTHTHPGTINQISLARYYYYLSIFYDSLRLISLRNEAIDSCISNEMKFNVDYHYASLVLEDNVKDLFMRGDYGLCIERSDLGEELIHRFYKYADSSSHIFYFIYYKASALRLLRRYAEEEQYLASKRSNFQNVKDKYYQAALFSLYGYLYESTGQYYKAIDFFLTAFHFDMLSERKDICPQLLDRVGQIYCEKLNRYTFATHYFQEALTYATCRKLETGNACDSFYILESLAKMYSQVKIFDSSFYFFQAAFNVIKPGITEKNLALNIQDYVNENTVEDVIKLVLDKANTYLQQYRYTNNRKTVQEALSIYKTADHLLNSIKVQLSQLESKLFWRSYSRSLYENAIEAASLENNLADIFYFFEKSRAVILNDELTERNKIDEKSILKMAQLEKRITVLKKQSEVSDEGSSNFQQIKNTLIVTELELNRLKQTIKETNPIYYQSFFDTSFIDLQKVHDYLLRNDQVILELFDGNASAYILVITPQKKYFHKIEKNIFDSLSSAFSNYLSQPDLLNRNFNSFISISNKLYQLLFQNIQLPPGRIIISPDGKYFPFEALITNKNPLTYFLEDHAVSYTYSARYLLNTFSTSSQNDRTFMGVAPIKFSGLPDLTGSDQSLKNVENYFSQSTSYVGNKATKNNFLNEFYKYKVIQLYTHATDSGYGGEPVIYFSDSALGLSDLLPEKKPVSNLIVLSACQTASGKLYSGEGVFSFNRSFSALGIPSTVSNLWQVNDQATYHLTELFYKYIAKGFPLDIALQKAKKEFIKDNNLTEYKLPSYWASSILIGKTDVISIQKTFEWKWIIALSLLAILLIGGWTINRKSILKNKKLNLY